MAAGSPLVIWDPVYRTSMGIGPAAGQDRATCLALAGPLWHPRSRSASEASLAEPDLLSDCLAGPRPPALPGRALDPPRRMAAWPGESSDSGGDDFSDAADSLADVLAAADFWADVLD